MLILSENNFLKIFEPESKKFGFFYLNIFGTFCTFVMFFENTLVVESVDTQDLKSCDPKRSCGFKSRLGYDCKHDGSV